jgi:hypothetical protein
MTHVVREPIQVYLTPEERAELDRVARDLGVSRSEVLRRGISAVHLVQNPRRYEGALRTLVEKGVLTPPTIEGGPPPPSDPVAPWAELSSELDRDRADR